MEIKLHTRHTYLIFLAFFIIFVGTNYSMKFMMIIIIIDLENKRKIFTKKKIYIVSKISKENSHCLSKTFQIRGQALYRSSDVCVVPYVPQAIPFNLFWKTELKNHKQRARDRISLCHQTSKFYVKLLFLKCNHFSFISPQSDDGVWCWCCAVWI